MPSIALGTSFIGPNEETFKTTNFRGNGAFGEVYSAVGEVSGAVVAVKLLPIEELQSDDSRLALLNEIRTAQQVRHPNVVEVLYVNDGTSSQIGPYVVMEYVSGGTLEKLLRVQSQSGVQIPLNRAIEMMIDIAQGARAINEKVIHRDIKPDNILIEGKTLKIGDFGISKFVDESTRQQTFKGGQHMFYMAPEAWENQTNTLKLDVYAVGLVFYQILTLQHPLAQTAGDSGHFRDWEKTHLFHQCADVRTLRQDVPLSVAQLLSRMVNKRPVDRPTWDDVLKILSQPEILNRPAVPTVAAAVEGAITRIQALKREELETSRRQSERDKQLDLYAFSCKTLLRSLEPVVEEFNTNFQHGKITIHQDAGSTVYRLPLGNNITINFFEPHRGIKIRNGEVIGGGWIGLSSGRSANLVLLKHSADDLYGQWSACEVEIMALVEPRSLIGRFGIIETTVIPFGFKDAFFYDQIQYATGCTHVFTYRFIDDVSSHFAMLLSKAYES